MKNEKLDGHSSLFNLHCSLSVLLAGMFALAAQVAPAADRYWNSASVGGSEESPYDIWKTANWDGSIGSGNVLNLSVSKKTYFKSASDEIIGNDFRPNSGDFVFLGPLTFMCLKNNIADVSVTVLKKGDWKIQGYQMYIGYAARSTMSFTNETGNVTVTGSRGNLYIADCEGSTGEVVKVSGDWSFEKPAYIGNGKDTMARFYNHGGDLDVADTFFIGNGKNSTANFYHRGGSLTAARYGVCLGDNNSGTTGSAYLEISGGAITNTAGNLSIGDGNSGGTAVVRVNGGEYCAQAGSVIVGSRGKGTLTIDSGRVMAPADGVKFCNNDKCVAGRDCFLDLNGGVVETKTVTYGSGSANATFTFNGGTLKALQADTLIASHDNLTVTVDAGGGTIDSGNYAITIAEDLGGTGGLTFTGGNTITLNGAVSYAGKTFVKAGTTLGVSAANAGTILANGLELVGVSTPGTYTVLTCSESLTDLVLSKVTCGVASDFSPLVDDNAIKVTVTALKSGYWTGKANDGDLSNGDNWSRGNVPTSGNANIFCATSSTLTKGATFAPSSITFLEGSAAVTIKGGKLTGIAAVTNLSSVVQTFANQVSFADNYRVHCETQPVNFSGGATATYPDASITDDTAASHTLMGALSFTENWTIPLQPSGKPFVLAPGSTIDGKVLSATQYVAAQPDLRIDEGAVATFEAVQAADTLVLWMNGGRLVSTGDFTILGCSGNNGHDIGYYVHKPNLGTIEANGLYKLEGSGGGIGLYVTNFVIGAGGFGMKYRRYAFIFKADSRITAKANFTIYQPIDGTSNTDWGLNLNNHALAIDTAGHKVTFDSCVHGSGAASIVKEGAGELVMRGCQKTYSGGTTVKGGTLTVKGSNTVGTGAVTLGAGTTLELTATSSQSEKLISNTLNLPTGEGEKATIRINGTRLRSGDHDHVIATLGNDATTANVELDGNSVALGGRKATLRVDGDELILNIKPSGFLMIIR